MTCIPGLSRTSSSRVSCGSYAPVKHTSREIAEKCGVPLLPGTGLIEDVEEAVREAGRIGFPVMLKSTAGGGGIGMQLCRGDEELRDAYQSVERLARSNFSQGGVFLEKYVERARHMLHLSLNRLEARLDPKRFLRIHRAHIVNLDHVARFRRDARGNLAAELADGTRLPVSRSRAQELRGLGV